MSSKTCQYDLSHFQSLVRAGQWKMLNLKRTADFKTKFGWDDTAIATALLSLESADFRKPAMRCGVEELPGHTEVDADQYLLFWDEVTNKRVSTYGKGRIEISIKIAIVATSKHELAGCVTFHHSL